MKKARCQDVQTNVDETHWSICSGTERKQEDKHCNGEAVWRKQGGRKKWGKERTNGENVGCEGVTQTLLHRYFCTQTLLHTDAFTHRGVSTFHTQTLLHTDAFTHTQTVYTQTLLHTQAFTHRLLHTDALTHPRFYAQRLLRTQTLYTQKLLHTHTEAFTDRLFHPRGPNKIIFFFSFWRSNLFSCLTVTTGNSKS